MDVKNKLIIKNSIWLYVRMIFVTLISLYTSRVILKILGFDDFGIYNVVAGIISFLTILTVTMSNATQRFLSSKKGQGDDVGFSLFMNYSIVLHIIIAIVFLILGETIGLYIVNNVLKFPPDRLFAASITYQMVLITLIFTIFKIPFNSLVVAYEKFSFIAWMSIIDVSVKLIAVFCLMFVSYDKLILYAGSLALVSIFQFLAFYLYTKNKYVKYKIKIIDMKKNEDCRNLFSFSMWNLLGNLSSTLANQGIGIVFNLFYPLAVNAALGLTNQVTNTLSSFTNNVQLAFRPQLLQSYSEANKERFLSLLYNASKWSFYLMMLFGVPLITNIDWILRMWLGEYPDYTSIFIIILFVFLVIDTVSVPIYNGIEANGKIKNIQIYTSIIYLINFIIAYLCCKVGLSPSFAILSKVLCNFIVYSCKIDEFKRKAVFFIFYDYWKNCLIPILEVGIFCTLFILISLKFEDSFVKLVLSSSLFMVTYIPFIYIFGVSLNERNEILTIIKKKFKI